MQRNRKASASSAWVTARLARGQLDFRKRRAQARGGAAAARAILA